MRPEEPVFRRHQVVSQPQVVPQPEVVRTQATHRQDAQSHWGAHFPTSYGQVQGRRLPTDRKVLKRPKS